MWLSTKNQPERKLVKSPTYQVIESKVTLAAKVTHKIPECHIRNQTALPLVDGFLIKYWSA